MATPEKRPNADGSVSWRVRYRLGGKQLSKSFYSAGAATDFCEWVRLFGVPRALELDRIEADRRAPEAPSVPTLDEWTERYIDALLASGSTKADYRSMYRNSFGQYIGHLRLDVLDRETIQKTIAKLQKTGGRGGKGYSDKSIANQHGLLSAMLSMAVEDEIIKKHPTARIRLPRSTEHETPPERFLEHDEFGALWEATLPHHRPVIETFVGTGIRWGEAEALNVGDVILKKKILRITKAAKWSGVKRLRIIGPPKTPMSRRDISLPDSLCETLEQLVDGRDPKERLFLAPRGGPLVHKTFWEHVWLPACERAELDDPRPRIHDLRHTHASWLLAEGVSMKAVQERLGHESIKTTMDLYAHLMPGAQQETADAASRAMAQALPGRGQLRAAG